MTEMTPDERKAWLLLRHTCISSTESSALFGLSPYATAFEVAVAKKAPEPEDFVGDERMSWGTRLQDAIAIGVDTDYGVNVEPMREYLVKPGTRMGSSFDYQITGCGLTPKDSVLADLFRAHGPGLLEIKNVDSLEYKNKWSEEAPDHIEIQVQHQLEVSGLKWAVIAALVGGNRAEILVRLRDEAVGAAISRKVDEFWKLLGSGAMPPVVMPEDAGVLIKLYGFADPEKFYDGRENEALRALCAAYTAAAAAEKIAEGDKKVAHARILEIIGRAEKALTEGFSISAGMVAESQISYTRKPYRGFRLTAKKEKADGKDQAP